MATGWLFFGGIVSLLRSLSGPAVRWAPPPEYRDFPPGFYPGSSTERKDDETNSPNKSKSTNGNAGLGDYPRISPSVPGTRTRTTPSMRDNGTTFDVLAIVREPGRGYDSQDRWALTVKAADRNAEILTLGCNPKRDEELAAAQAYLARGGTMSINGCAVRATHTTSPMEIANG